MQHSEAEKKIENWLKIPVDYESVFPALHTLRGTSSFSSYLNQIADSEYKSASEVLADLELYEEEATRKAAAKQSLEDKLSALSGKKQTLNYEQQSDILDDIEKQRRDKTDAEIQEEKLNQGYESFVQRYEKRAQQRSASQHLNDASEHPDTPYSTSSTAMVKTCPHCGHPLTQREQLEPITGARILLIIIFAFICLPLCIIPLIAGRNKETIHYCTRCSRTIR